MSAPAVSWECSARPSSTNDPPDGCAATEYAAQFPDARPRWCRCSSLDASRLVLDLITRSNIGTTRGEIRQRFSALACADGFIRAMYTDVPTYRVLYVISGEQKMQSSAGTCHDSAAGDPPVLIISEYAPIAALLGMFVELAGLRPCYPESAEGVEAELSRRAPAMVLLDAEHRAAGADTTYERAAEAGAALLLFSSSRRLAEFAGLARRRHVEAFALPMSYDAFHTLLTRSLNGRPHADGTAPDSGVPTTSLRRSSADGTDAGSVNAFGQ